MVVGATSPLIRIRSARVRLPPIIPHRQAAKNAVREPATKPTVRRPPLSRAAAMDDSPRTDSDQYTGVQHHRTLFVCGFVPKRWHNSALQAVIHDLIPQYYVACNGEKWEEGNVCRNLVSNADVVLFFVNEFTLGNSNCLLTLQYAWHMMVPIIMLRPPRTKLVMRPRKQHSEDIIAIQNCSIIRSPSSRWSLLDNSAVNTIDYPTLEDIICKGYRASVVYDRLDHRRSMTNITDRLDRLLKPTQLGSHSPINPINGNGTPSFYLSPSNDSSKSLVIGNENLHAIQMRANDRKKDAGSEIRQSKSMNNLNNSKPRKKTPFPEIHKKKIDENATDEKIKLPPLATDEKHETDGSRNSSNNNTHRSGLSRRSTVSRTSSMDRRMSMSSLDDPANYQQTQYLVFPLRDTTKKPTLIKFPEDLQEEQYDDLSVWGSDTSLEEEALLAPKITRGISIDLEDPSPIGSPAPYIENI